MTVRELIQSLECCAMREGADFPVYFSSGKYELKEHITFQVNVVVNDRDKKRVLLLKHSPKE